MTDLAAQKSSLRQQMRKQRKLLAAENPDASLALVDFISEIPSALVIAGYWPCGSEIDPRPLMAALCHRGAQLCLPVVTAPDQPLIFRRFNLGDALQIGITRNQEPLENADEITPDLVLVPLLAFDKAGQRLGQGGGFYDRTLEKLAASTQFLGIAFAGQCVDSLPTEYFDQPLGGVLTEAGLFKWPSLND